MEDIINRNENQKQNQDTYGKKTVAVPKPEKNIAVDVNGAFTDNIIMAGINSQLDFSEIEKFTTISTRRDELFSLIDVMANDSKVQAVLEAYVEDSTERNDQGQIVWAESADSNVSQYINFLLDSLNIDKNIHAWVYSLCKYGDLYVRLFRRSDVKDDLFDEEEEAEEEDKTLNESIIYRTYSVSDKYAHYVEMIPNPAEVYELTKFGKSYAYIKTTVPDINSYSQQNEWNNLDVYNLHRYRFKRGDIDLFPATEFVHACIDEGNNRYPEQVDIFRTDADYEADKTTLSYKVRRGQSILYPAFKVWRQLQLLENSVLLNRVTRSSLVRLLQIEVGDMPKEQVEIHMRHFKQLIEQKAAFSVSNSLSEYTNPGPIENNAYIPTHGGIGAVSTVDIGGGDPNVKDLADLDYYMNLFYGTLRVPKQFFAQTDDATGFNGGTSLTIISSRYAKSVKHVQQSIIQMITDMVNLMLIDKGLQSYINKFAIKMQSPTTQEDVTRRENLAANIDLVSSIMNIIGDVEDPVVRLRIIKQLFSNNLVSPGVITILQEEIQKMEKERKKGGEEGEGGEHSGGDTTLDIDIGSSGGESGGGDLDFGGSDEMSIDFSEPAPAASEESGSLPDMSDLGMDFADNSAF